MNEIWKDIEGYEGLYQVSNLGRVKSLERVVERSDGRTRKQYGRILKPGLNTYGYPHVVLCRESLCKTTLVHTLVAQAFLYKKTICTEVNHRDGNKKNNSVWNLEWVTSEENKEHALREGLHHKPRKAVHMLSLDGDHVMTFPSMSEAARYLGVFKGGISGVCGGKGKTAYGYKWKYASEGESL
ncbi:NUMOD4 domain-containing protein [Bacillus cereus]|uniref:NUMOD4 domain-containing protein n=1 Tax=Bacillus cereus TaxID=1396 RepID=UPI003D98184D